MSSSASHSTAETTITEPLGSSGPAAAAAGIPNRLLPYLFGATIFTAAFLLFQVQPLIGKAILPWFGGGASVWATCLAFFQATLFLGYLYAHLLVKAGGRMPLLVHGCLLGAALLFLPIYPDPAWKPEGAANAALSILGLLVTTIGLPFFLLASTSPLIQAWYASTSATGLPYRFYALSNVASLAGLLCYPFLIEPFLPVRLQANAWSAAFAAFAALSILCALGVFRRPRLAGAPFREASSAPSQPPSAADKALWLLLPASASALLVGVTTHLTQNVAPIPFLWILPLGLYLLTFVLCFDSSRWYQPDLYRVLAAGALYTIGYWWLQRSAVANLMLVIGFIAAAFFVCCMFCHGELARRKPDPRHLTAFYLMLSLGGALGGLFAGLLAPHIFRGSYEIPAALIVCALLACSILYLERSRTYLIWGGLTLLLAFFTYTGIQAYHSDVLFADRNFYGMLRVKDERESDPAVRAFYHGTITHGVQRLDPATAQEPTAYFCRSSGAGIVLSEPRTGPARIGVIGLGAGTLAAYARPGDFFRFYELDPAVIEVAQDYFTFLSASGARIEFSDGDGRLSLEREAPQEFDFLIIDAFSGDSVPIHLITVEAIELYLRHLAPNGIIAFHTSNLYLDLNRVVRGLAEAHDLQVATHGDNPPEGSGCLASEYAIVARESAVLPSALRGSPGGAEASPVTWTDTFSNLWRVLR